MNNQFSSRLRRVIQASGLNPTHFAHKAGVPQGTISKCLNGHVPGPKILLRISRMSGKSVHWLLTGRETRGLGEGYVADRPARYGRRVAAGRSEAREEIWVAKLLKVLRSGSRRKKQTIKDLLDVLSR
ncbi:MAG: helix-turn-helix transcriptional regulator [Deltaproteobacteria bacterium]|nr:helix-turn-helix transcriptional regulator [Deltaproteobacteria bacterium]